jgi:hypothetical protein
MLVKGEKITDTVSVILFPVLIEIFSAWVRHG